MTIFFVVILLGIVLIGIGLIVQGWFILDLNKRVSYANGHLIVRLEEIQQQIADSKKTDK